MQKVRRRIYLIDKKLQLRFTFLVVALVLIYSLFLGGATYLNYKISCIVFDTTSVYNPVLEEAIKSEGRRTLATTTIFLVINGIVVGLVFILLTHKVAGPLYRLQKNMEAIGGGKLPRKITLRKNDELTHVADTFNDMAEGLRKAAETEAADLHAASEKLTGILEKLKQGSQSEDLLGELQACLEKVKGVHERRQGMATNES
ncbi:MAG: HAMP domain-containing protein [Chitinivibrionales bacterium]|nr:HAMP domain-containing protein [Chitinivibrionales bacterium]